MKSSSSPKINSWRLLKLFLLTLCLVGLIAGQADQAAAEYLYFDGADDAHYRLIEDFQHAHLDVTNLAPTAQRGLQALPPMLRVPHNQELTVCQTLAIQYPNGAQFGFRTFQGSEIFDWVVHVTRSPQVVLAIVALPPRPASGPPPANLPPGAPRGTAPAVLPPYTPGTEQTLTPPTQLACSTGVTLVAPDPARDPNCERWPRMCEQPQ
jgi:hypothetical protein